MFEQVDRDECTKLCLLPSSQPTDCVHVQAWMRAPRWEFPKRFRTLTRFLNHVGSLSEGMKQVTVCEML